MSALEPYRDYLTIVSNTDCRMAEAVDLPEIGGDHFRSSAVFLTQAHPKQTQGSDVRVGQSLDQIYAPRYGQDTPIPSMQLCIENIDQAGACAYGYACVYTDSVSWATPSQPLPMIRDPRAAFDQLFGMGATPAERAAHRKADRSILDWIGDELGRVRTRLGPSDRARLSDYLDDVREIERRIQTIEATNRQRRGARAARRAGRRARRLRRARQADVRSAGRGAGLRHHPRVHVQDGARQLEPRLPEERRQDRLPSRVAPPGARGSHSAVRRHQQVPRQPVPYFLEKLKNTPDGDGSLLDHSLVIYGSPMGDPNVHNHVRCPLFIAGHASGKLKGNLHSSRRTRRRWPTRC